MQKNRKVLAILLISGWILLPFAARSSDLNVDTLSGSNRKFIVAGAHVVGFTGTMLALNQAWYKDFPRSSFHFHDDSKDWLQIDKAGHVFSSYQLSKTSFETFRWSGFSNAQSALFGAVAGNLFLTTVEVLDGFSEQWGASVSDFASNTLGSAVFYSQQMIWENQRIVIKYSYTDSGLAQYRPDLLGSNLPERVLKDYNSMRLWVSGNLHELVGAENNIPKWLGVAVGYGAYGMLGSVSNPSLYNNMPLPDLVRYRRFFLAPDLDLGAFETPYPFVNQVLEVLNVLKVPTPALEYNSEQGLVFHWILF